MPGAEFSNATPFAVKELFLADEEGRDLLTVVVKASYSIRQGAPLTLAEEQLPVNPAGVYHGDPATSSPRYEPEVAPLKLATDVVLIGHAHTGRRRMPYVDVGLQLGPITKILRVFGNRQWYRSVATASISEPEPFEVIPLVYERAFGGWDRTSPNADDHTVEPRNPVGIGYHNSRRGLFVEGAPLPNLESPGAPITSYNDAPPPAGFGFVGPGWLPRVRYGGTYDASWAKNRMPLLPNDFDRHFFSAAPADQIAGGFLRGDEFVRMANASPEGRLEFALPAEPPPQINVTLRNGSTTRAIAPLDTVIVDTDAKRVTLIWRACFPIHRKIYELRAMSVVPNPASRFAGSPLRLVNA